MIAADLVVDASGRGALTLALLDAVDWQRREVTEVGVDISYVSAVVEIPPDPPPEWKVAVTFPDPPHLAFERSLATDRTQSLDGVGGLRQVNRVSLGNEATVRVPPCTFAISEAI